MKIGMNEREGWPDRNNLPSNLNVKVVSTSTLTLKSAWEQKMVVL